MFTGIVQYTGRLEAIESTAFGSRLWLDIGPLAEKVKLGDSVAVNGVCLTVGQQRRGSTGFDAVAETLKTSSLASLSVGDAVNLELALRLGDGLDGHIVQGHVDGVASVTRIDRSGGQWNIHFSCDRALSDEMVAKGSVAIDGVSLTLTGVLACGAGGTGGAGGAGSAGGAGVAGSFSVTVIPTTLRETTLADLKPGDTVNIETDILGKYVRRMLGGLGQSATGGESGLTLEKLRDAGFMD